MKELNINHDVFIRITKKGWEYLYKTKDKDYINHCIIPNQKIINEVEYYKLQLWYCFDLFPMFNGCDLLFETNILIEDDNLK